MLVTGTMINCTKSLTKQNLIDTQTKTIKLTKNKKIVKSVKNSANISHINLWIFIRSISTLGQFVIWPILPTDH